LLIDLLGCLLAHLQKAEQLIFAARRFSVSCTYYGFSVFNIIVVSGHFVAYTSDKLIKCISTPNGYWISLSPQREIHSLLWSSMLYHWYWKLSSWIFYTRCLRKSCAKFFLSELRQISVNVNNFWYVDGKMAEILFYIYIFHLISLILSHYLVKHKSTKFYNFSGKTVKHSVKILSYFHQFNNLL